MGLFVHGSVYHTPSLSSLFALAMDLLYPSLCPSPSPCMMCMFIYIYAYIHWFLKFSNYIYK